MALIAAPTLPLRGIEWTFDRPAQINTSLTGKRTSEDEPWFGKWHARVELAVQQGEENFRAIRSFLVRCDGPVNTFQLPATVEPQNSNSGVTVASTAAVGASTMNLSGTTTPLVVGQMVTVGDQLLLLTDDQLGSTITFEPPLRAQATAGASVETANPYAVVHLASSEIGWSIGPWRRFATAFGVEEAF